MFGRRKTTNEELLEDPAHPHREGAKNRPTPKRRDQEAARKRPLVVDDRKEAKRQDRARRQAQHAKQQQALRTGDERHLPIRDRGPVKRFIRDTVDGRWNLGEFLLPVMLIVLALSFVPQAWAMNAIFLGVYGVTIVSVLDAYLLWRRTKAKIIQRWGPEIPAGSAMYCIMRCFQMRWSRRPVAMVKRGEPPRD